ncbi:MAG: serine/threonine protein kinase, partial [Candidatus Acidiferrales bacterium]
MPSVNPELWREASPYLDRALELSAEERAAWLESFRASRPDLVGFVEDLLKEQGEAAQENFLERSPISPGEVPPEGRKGQSLGQYTMLSPVGQGGMGSVWLAERSDGRFERRVAVKVLRFALGTRGAAERFAREGKILGQLVHSHIAGLSDAGVTPGGEPYLVLEYVEGEAIDEYCDQHTLSVDARLQFFLDVLDAVSAAHAQLIVHRDIKPSNVLVRKDGQAKLLDFGIAKLLADTETPAEATAVTLEAGTALTPRFAAPEQLTGRQITTATDVYALGLLLYELLTGRHPTGAATQSTADLVKAIVETEPPHLSEVVEARDEETARKRGASPERLRRILRGDLELIVGKALKKIPAERYASVSAFGDDLRRYLRHEPISARPDAISYRVRKYVRRHRVGVGVAAGLAFLLAGFSVIQTVELRRITRERDRADRIADFMTGVFKVSDPNEGTGQTVTAREVLDKAANNIATSLSTEPELQAQMLHVMGRAYLNLGLFAQAETLFRQGIQASKSFRAKESRETLNTTHDLAWAVLQQGRVSEAEGIERRLLETQRRVMGRDHPDTLATMEELAFTVCNEGKGRCTEGISLTQDVLEKQKRLLGPDAYYTLVTMDNLAIMLAGDGRLNDAIKLQQESLERHLRVLGPENIGTINAMLNLGEFQRDAGRDDEALWTFQKLLQTETRVLGPDQGETAATRYDLASMLLRKGRKDEAISLLGQSVDHGLPPRIALGLET